MQPMSSIPTLILKALIAVYRALISPMLGPNCRFHPSCSVYAFEAVDRFGALKGSWLAIKRLGRCHPWHPGGYDPVPDGTHHSSPAGETDSLKSSLHG